MKPGLGSAGFSAALAGVKDAQGSARRLEDAPQRLWVVLVGFTATVKSLMNS